MSGILLKAVSAGRPRQIRLLLDSGISVEQTDDCGQTPLIRCIFVEHQRSRLKILKLLLRNDALVSNTDIVGRSALSWACLYGYDKEVMLLLKHADVDLDLNQGDMNGQTALFHAATSGSAATVKLIVDSLNKFMLSCDVPSYSGITPLMQAGKLGHDVCASILIHQGKATVGLNMEASEKFINREAENRWASKLHSKIYPDHPCHQMVLVEKNKSERVKKCSKIPRFPPIISQSIAQKIKYRENRAAQIRIYTPANSDDDTTYGSEVSFYTEENFNEIHLETDDKVSNVDDSSKLSIRSLSITSSTEANANSSENEFDINHLDFTGNNNKAKNMFKPTQDLPMLFRIQEEQNTSSYLRSCQFNEHNVLPGISSTDTSMDGEYDDIDAPKKSARSKNKVSPKKHDAKNRMLRKQHQGKLLTFFPNTPRTLYPPPLPDGNSSSENEISDAYLQKHTALPDIGKNKSLRSSIGKTNITILDLPKESLNAGYSEI